MLLEGKVIAVIGGNGLIGSGTVGVILKQGATVVTASRSGKVTPSLQEKLVQHRI